MRANPSSGASERAVRIPIDGIVLDGDLVVPEGARGLVIFAHGSGSGRHSPRNRYVAGELQKGALGTLLLDLLTRDEEREDALTGHLRFDIELLTARLGAATDWAVRQTELWPIPIGYFGASTGAAAALAAAAQRPGVVHAVVSRGGRPDLAGSALHHVRAPTLLIVGGDDTPVLALNRDALRMIAARHKEMLVVPHATHLFEEPGALEEVARLARAWFERHLARRPEAAAHAGW